MLSRRNAASREVRCCHGAEERSGREAEGRIADLDPLPAAEEDDRAFSEELNDALSRITTTPMTTSPSAGPDDNVVTRVTGESRAGTTRRRNTSRSAKPSAT